MASSTPPSILPTSALALGLEAFVAIRAASRAGFADARATFEYSFAAPLGAGVGFMLFAGLEPLLDALERFRGKSDELAWLESVGAIDAATRARLMDGRFLCDVDAAPEGSVVFPGEALLTIEGPFWQAQLVGALVESALGEATLVATKAARCVLAADGAAVIEVGSATARRMGGAPLLARASYIAGAHATTSALAGKRHGIPVRAIEPTRMAAALRGDAARFDAWLGAAPQGAIVRLDAGDPRASLEQLTLAVKRAKGASWGDGAVGVAIDVANAVELARDIELAFEEAGLRQPSVVVAGDLDELAILELRRQAAPFGAFTVSSHVADEATALSRYALVALEDAGAWSPRLEVGASAATTSDPGRKMLLRYFDADGRPVADVAQLTNERALRARDGRFVDRATGFVTSLRGATTSAPLLANVMRAGKRVNAPENARTIRDRAARAVAALPPQHRRLVNPAPYRVGITPALAALKAELLERG